MAKYRVVFEHAGLVRTIDTPSHWGIAAIKDGMWLTKDLTYDVASKTTIFIPYHKVQWIENLE